MGFAALALASWPCPKCIHKYVHTDGIQKDIGNTVIIPWRLKL